MEGLTRRGFMLGTAGLLAGGSRSAWARSGIAFGAIRWDAQYCDIQGQPCGEEERILGPRQWQSRAPLHTRITGPDSIRFEPSQETFDAEIRAAASAGLSYWAYVTYTDPRTGSIDLQHSMMKGLAYHRASAIRSKVKVCLIVATNALRYQGRFGQAVDVIAGLIGEGHYQTCLGGRPLLYLYYSDPDLAAYWGGSLVNLKASLDSLRARCRSQNLGDPFVAVMAAPPEKSEQIRVALQADAISIYAGPIPPGPEVPYVALADAMRGYWQKQLRAAKAGIVPTVMIGWDKRPRKERPPSWEKNLKAGEGLDRYVKAPTPEEFAAECQKAVDFINDHPQPCAARTALIYAWNENSEGGPLAPSLGDPDARKLSAAAPIIKP